METVTGLEQYELDQLMAEAVESPEDMLIRLEEALISGELTESEVRDYLFDMSH